MAPDREALFLGPHPDDVELFCGGTVLRLLSDGHRIAIVDLTRGEMGSRGDAATRAAECDAATNQLGLSPDDRRNLELPDTQLAVTDAMAQPIVQALRDFRPRLFFAPHPNDVHPDHVAAAGLAQRAWFLAGLTNYAPGIGPAFRPAVLLQFPGNDHVEPSFGIDISDFEAEKRQLVECYASQVNQADNSHHAKKLDPLERTAARDRALGARLGCRAAEPFVAPGPLLAQDVTKWFGAS